jgi:hypothetical protein
VSPTTETYDPREPDAPRWRLAVHDGSISPWPILARALARILRGIRVIGHGMPYAYAKAMGPFRSAILVAPLAVGSAL